MKTVEMDDEMYPIKSSDTHLLLEEYKICASRADQFSALMWQLGTLLVTLSAGAIAIVAQFSDFSPRRFVEVLLMASLGILLVQWWNKVADRWNSYIRVWYHRMQEIEPILNMWTNRDIALLDGISKEATGDYSLHLGEQARSEVLKASGVLRGHSTISIREQRRHLFLLVSVGWAALAIYFAVGTILQTVSHYRSQQIDRIDLILAIATVVVPLILLSILLVSLSRRIDIKAQVKSIGRALLPGPKS